MKNDAQAMLFLLILSPYTFSALIAVSPAVQQGGVKQSPSKAAALTPKGARVPQLQTEARPIWRLTSPTRMDVEVHRYIWMSEKALLVHASWRDPRKSTKTSNKQQP